MRRGLLVFACLIASFAPMSHAAAGGYDQLFYQRHYFEPGESVTLSKEIYAGRRPGATLKDGPYSAYLVSEHGWWHGNPKAEGIRVAPVDASVAGHETIGVRFTFTVPEDLSPGFYVLGVCGRTCSKWAGALGPTEIGIAETAEEARLLRRIDRIRVRLSDVEYQVTRDGLRSAVNSLTEPLHDELYLFEDDTTDGLARIEARLDQHGARLRGVEAPPWYLEPVALLLGAVLLAGLGALVGGLIATGARTPPHDTNESGAHRDPPRVSVLAPTSGSATVDDADLFGHR